MKIKFKRSFKITMCLFVLFSQYAFSNCDTIYLNGFENSVVAIEDCSPFATDASTSRFFTAQDGVVPLNTIFPSDHIGNQLKNIANIINIRSNLGVNWQIFFASPSVGYDIYEHPQ